MADARIQLEDAWFRYPSVSSSLLHRVPQRWIFCGLDLELNSGDRVALLGNNGAGKSTLLRIMAGVYPTLRGRVSLSGSIHPFFGKGVGMQRELTGRENLKVRGLYHGLKMSEIRRIIDWAQEFIDLGSAFDEPVYTYSNGMRSRLFMAAYAFVEAQIYLIDEGQGGGDRKFTKHAKEWVKGLYDDAEIAVFASHNRNFLAKQCNRAIWLQDGKVRAQGPFDEICNAFELAEGIENEKDDFDE